MAWFEWMRGVDLPEQNRWILDRHLNRLQQLNGEVQAVEGRLEAATKDDTVVQSTTRLRLK